jgi:hypothetical protein
MCVAVACSKPSREARGAKAQTRRFPVAGTTWVVNASIIEMGPIFALLTVVLTGLVLGICVIGAMWEGARVNKRFKELEQQLRRRQLQ